jgi:hypothetical protein
MGFLDSIKSIFTGSASDEAAYWIYVRCRRCGEVIKTRLDLHNNLTERDEGGFIARKTLVGSGLCFERIEVTLFFDPNRQLVDREIARGEFITAEAYESAQTESQATD